MDPAQYQTECSHFNLFTGVNARELSKLQGGLWGGLGPVSSGMLTWGTMGWTQLNISRKANCLFFIYRTECTQMFKFADQKLAKSIPHKFAI